MGLFSSLRNIKKWFTDKTGITGSKEGAKRKHEECETISNKRARMDDSLVEVVEISDESLSEAEETEITEPGPSTTPLRASPPVMLISDDDDQRRIKSSARTVDITESKTKVFRSFSLSGQPLKPHQTVEMVRSASGSLLLKNKYSNISTVKGLQQSSSSMDSRFSSLNISNSPSSNDSKEKILARIIKNYVLPKPVDTDLSNSSIRSPQSLRKEYFLNNSISSQTSGKENLEFPELSLYKNRILKQEMFYERILRKFKEKQVAVAKTLATIKQKPPEDAFREKLEAITNELKKIEPEKKREVFPGYSKEKCDFIKCQMSRPPMEHISVGKNIRINDLKTLYKSSGWLNDEVVNHYISMVVARDSNSLHMFDTFFYTKLSTQGYQSVRRWSRKKDIFACKKMLTPIHLGNHWCLICVNFVEKTIKYYDSLRGKNPKCLNDIFNYLKEEYKNKKNEDFDCREWQLMDADDCPKQLNGYDCGVFTCVNAEFLARDAVLDFVQADIPLFRQKLCYEILKNQLCY